MASTPEGEITFTMQGRDTPASASGSGQAGFPTSSSSDCTNTEVGPSLASVLLKAPSEDHMRNWREQLQRMGEQIQQLADFVAPKHNVHSDIKRRINSLKLTHTRLAKLEGGFVTIVQTVVPKADTQVQTTPTLALRAYEQATRATKYVGTPKSSKRKETSPLQDDARARNAKRRMGKEKLVQKPLPEETEMETEKHPNPVQPSQQPWETVESRKKVKKKKGAQQLQQRTRRERPGALIIKPNKGKTYAEVVSKVKHDPTLQEVGLGFAGVRKTQAGHVLLLLKKTVTPEKTEEYSSAIHKVLGDDAAISKNLQHMLLEVIHLDVTATKEEVLAAVEKELGENSAVGPEIVVSTRETYGGTRKALLKLEIGAAKKLLKKKTLRVGWSNCRIREVLQPLKCFKCWQYGHIAGKCQSQVDRRELCVKCGIEGHKAAECSKDTPPCCILCKEAGSKETNHVSGTRKCPAYMKAYQALCRKWQ